MDPLDDFYTHHPFVGQMRFSTFFKKNPFLDLIINFENAASHRYVVQKAESL